MPNFKAKTIKKLDFPVKIGDVSFEFSTLENKGTRLVYTKVENDSFFIQISKRNDEFVIKIDKLTKITNLAAMQRALNTFMDNFCDDIISKAFNYNANKELANNVISSVYEFKEFVKNNENKVFLEIGFGSGRHLLFQAKNNPKNTYIGIEIHKPSLIQVSKLARDISNLKLLDFDARIAIKELDDNSLDGIFLHFPVPWDDAPHRRVVSNDFKNELDRVLKVGGFFELRSDSDIYTKYTEEIFKDSDYDFYKNQNARITSKYEDRWLRMNKNIYDFISYKRANNVNFASNISDECVNFIIDYKKLDYLKHIGDDYFVKITRIYEANGFKVLALSYGDFDMPSTSYLQCFENTQFKFLFYDFCPTNCNKKAFLKLKELLE